MRILDGRSCMFTTEDAKEYAREFIKEFDEKTQKDLVMLDESAYRHEDEKKRC